MSYILDALKKIEKEKTRKASGAGMVSISGELFKDERRPSSSGTVWKLVAVVVAASLVTFGGTWLFLKADKGRDAAKQSSTPPVSAARPVASQAPPVTEPASAVTPQTPLVATPGPVTVNKAARSNVPVVKATAPSNVEKRSKPQYKFIKQVSSARQQMHPVVSTIPPPSDISVSGIAWQDEHSARRAVVNGFLMQEGGSVSSAKISEIFQDRVRFSREGSFFDVYLPASGFPGKSK